MTAQRTLLLIVAASAMIVNLPARGDPSCGTTYASLQKGASFEAEYTSARKRTRFARFIKRILFSTALLLYPSSPLIKLAMAGGSVSGGGRGFAYRKGNDLIMADLLYKGPIAPFAGKNSVATTNVDVKIPDGALFVQTELRKSAESEIILAFRKLEEWREFSPAIVD